MSENKDLKIIKKLYGESMMHLCREYFPTILDEEGRLSKIMQDHFAPTKALHENLVAQHKVEDFRDYINYLYERDLNPQEREEKLKSPAELLSSAGYILYPECKTEDEIQSFKKYYASGEEICTFKGNRLRTCRVWFAVKKDVDEIKREDFTSPVREDRYGTSVISIQFSKDGGYLSIKNRYNHSVPNPDCTFQNNLDNIIAGLDSSFRRVFYLPQKKVFNTWQGGLLNFVLGPDGKYYHYNVRIDNYYFCEDNIVIDGEHITQFDKNNSVLMDNFLLNKQNKTIEVLSELYGFEDSCFDDFGQIVKIQENKKENGEKEFILTNATNQNVILTINKYNQVVGFVNENITETKTDFLRYNKYIKNVDLPNVTKIANEFLSRTVMLEQINIPNVETIGNYCMRYCQNLDRLYMPKVREIGDCFLSHDENLKLLGAPNLEKVGANFLSSNKKLEEVYFPKLREIKSQFLSENNLIKKLNLPNVETIGSEFMANNAVLESINLPKIKKINDSFLEANTSLKNIDFPTLTSCGCDFLTDNKTISNVNLPKLEFCGSHFLMNNTALKTLDLPNLKGCDHYFLTFNKSIEKVNLPKLEYCGMQFMSNNTELKTIDLPNVEAIGDHFLRDNSKIEKIILPKVTKIDEGFMCKNTNLRCAVLPMLKEFGYKFLSGSLSAKVYAPYCVGEDNRIVDNKTNEQKDELSF